MHAADGTRGDGGGPLSGRAVGGRGPRLPLLIAGSCMFAGSAALTGLTPDTSLALLLVAYAVFGLGFGTVNAPITFAAVSGMPNNQAGVAAAVASTSRQVGQTLGVAITGSILGTAAANGIGTHLAPASHAAWWLIAGCGLVVVAVGAATTGAWARASASRCRAQLEEEPTPTPLVAA